MTPGVSAVIRAGISHSLHEYEHNPAHASYGLEAAEKLNVAEKIIFKTLILDVGNKTLAVAIIPVSTTLNLKAFAKLLGVKKAQLASAPDVERSSGYVLGGVSPLGQKKALKTILDDSANLHETIFVSAGRRGLEIQLSPADLCNLCNARSGKICRS